MRSAVAATARDHAHIARPQPASALPESQRRASEGLCVSSGHAAPSLAQPASAQRASGSNGVGPAVAAHASVSPSPRTERALDRIHSQGTIHPVPASAHHLPPLWSNVPIGFSSCLVGSCSFRDTQCAPPLQLMRLGTRAWLSNELLSLPRIYHRSRCTMVLLLSKSPSLLTHYTL